MADRKVTFTLGTAVDQQTKRDAAELAALLKSIKAAADGATKAVRETFAASSRGRGGSGGSWSGSGGRHPPGPSGGFDRGYDRAVIADMKRAAADERREREANIRDMQRAAAQEKKILADRVRANVEAGRAIRDAARQTRAGHYTTRQQEELVQRSRSQAETAARVRASIEQSRAAREAALATKAGNYRARAAGTYGAGFGRGGGPSIPTDDEFRSHIEGVARAYEAQERAAARAAAVQQRNLRELVSGSKQAAAGVGNIARAFVYLGVSGEENVEKALRVLAKFEAGMAGVRGVSDVVGGLSKASRAYRALGPGAGLAAGIGAVGAAGTIGLGASALAVGGGLGFGAARLYLGEQQFANFTDWTGATTYQADRNAANRAGVATTANKQMRRRGQLAERWADETTLAGFDVADAEVRGGLGAAASTARAGVYNARQRTAALESRISTGRAGNIEEFSAERVAAKQGELAALNTALQLEERRKTILKQTVEAEREKTRAVREGIEAAKASLGLADDETVRLAERGAAKRAKGQKLSREEAGALGTFFGEQGQQEAAKLGEDVLKRNPELAKLADEIAKTRAANEKAVLVKVEETLTGKIVVTPDASKLQADLEGVIKDINEQIRRALREEFEATRKDREMQSDLQRRSSGA